MRILNLGGGQQSTAVYLLAANGEIPPIDVAIFADTGEEPAWVYETVRELERYRTHDGKAGAPILVRSRTDASGKPVRLGDTLIGKDGGRYASVPAFIKHTGLYVTKGKDAGKNAVGKIRRQCTNEFKISVVEQTIRRELLGLPKGSPNRGPRITEVFGFDCSEGERIFRTKGRIAQTTLAVGDFPLFDLQWKRADCTSYIQEVWGREVLPSACSFCPLVNNAFRRLLRDRDPASHARACEVDEGMRQAVANAGRMLDGELYIHRSTIPLAQVDLDRDDSQGLLPLLSGDCLTGFCGH